MSKVPSTGLKAPNKIGKPTGLPQPRSGLPTPSSSRAQSALEKSARAAGIPSKIAENYAASFVEKLPGPEPEHSQLPTDDFIIGDRVYVGGTKPGHIAFIGETQFAPGEWAGIVLDQPVGKNDGSVAGVRYFQCETKRGVFARLSKVSRHPINHDTDSGHHPAAASAPIQETPVKKALNGGSVMPAPSAPKVAPTPRTAAGLSKKSIGGSSSNLSKSASRSGSVADLTPGGDSKYHHVSVGDRVVVGGSKTGILRYMGVTDFAKGDWAGVELDEPLGKNDGAVAGKRYFTCKPMFGLFAPVHKVSKAGGAAGSILSPLSAAGLSAAGLVTPSPRRGSMPKYGLGMSLSRERSGSQDSISSIGSSASSVSRSRNAKSSTSRPTTLNLSATNTALQKALKEKEEHIEQLLRERDMERSELARAASQVDEAESMLTALRTEHQRHIEENEEQTVRMQSTIEELEKKKSQLVNALEEEKRRVEDMQFTIEEEAINKGDLETQNATEMVKLSEYEEQLQTGQARVEKLEKEVSVWKQCYNEEKVRYKDAEESSVVYLDQVEELTHKLTVAENQIKSMEASKAEQGSKVSEVSGELAAKSGHISTLESQVQKLEQNAKKQTEKISELEEELTETNAKRQKQQDTLDELMKKLATSDTNSNSLTNELQQLKSQLADSQRQLTAQEDKTAHLEDDKTKLEEQIAELMANSGDSSHQLTLMSEQLREKERKIEELQAGLSKSSQEVGKLNETIERKREEAERELDTLLGKHQEDLTSFQERVDEKQAEIEKTQNKLSKLKESHEEEKVNLEKQNESETNELKKQLETANTTLNTERAEAQETKDLVQKHITDAENSKFEKEKLEKLVKKVETEKESLSMERDALLSEKDRLAVEQESLQKAADQEKEKVEKIMAEKDSLSKQITKLEEAQQSLIGERENLVKEKGETETAIAEASDKVALLEEASIKVEALAEVQLKIETLKEEVASLQQELERTKKEEAAKKEELKEECERLKKDKESAEAQSRKRESELRDLMTVVDNTKAQMETISTKLKETQETVKAMDQLKADLLVSQQQSTEFESRLKMVEMEREALKMQVTKLKAVQQEKQLLETAQVALKSELEALKQKGKKQEDDFEIEKTSLQNMVETTQLLLQQKEKDLDNLQNEVTVLQGENAMLQSRAASLKSVEQEKQVLEQKVKSLEKAAAESKANANIISNIDTTGDPVLAQLKEDKETADGQIDFLNSVIVDMQRKNEELTIRLQAMESGEMRNGTPHDEDYINAPRKPAPRLFCDICDMFDLHDTDDCPTQAMSDSPPATTYHNERHQERPYCTICEVFGHWTQDCDDEQTF